MEAKPIYKFSVTEVKPGYSSCHLLAPLLLNICSDKMTQAMVTIVPTPDKTTITMVTMVPTTQPTYYEEEE